MLLPPRLSSQRSLDVVAKKRSLDDRSSKTMLLKCCLNSENRQHTVKRFTFHLIHVLSEFISFSGKNLNTPHYTIGALYGNTDVVETFASMKLCLK
jgi:hypothetical protein